VDGAETKPFSDLQHIPLAAEVLRRRVGYCYLQLEPEMDGVTSDNTVVSVASNSSNSCSADSSAQSEFAQALSQEAQSSSGAGQPVCTDPTAPTPREQAAQKSLPENERYLPPPSSQKSSKPAASTSETATPQSSDSSLGGTKGSSPEKEKEGPGFFGTVGTMASVGFTLATGQTPSEFGKGMWNKTKSVTIDPVMTLYGPGGMIDKAAQKGVDKTMGIDRPDEYYVTKEQHDQQGRAIVAVGSMLLPTPAKVPGGGAAGPALATAEGAVVQAPAVAGAGVTVAPAVAKGTVALTTGGGNTPAPKPEEPGDQEQVKRNVYPDFEPVKPQLQQTAREQTAALSKQVGLNIPENRVLDAPWIGKVKSSASTSEGWLRNESRFWSEWKRQFPDDAKLLGENQTVTKELADKYGWPTSGPDNVVGQKLVHHHIDNGSLTVALPEKVHQKLSGQIHRTPTVVGRP
jgi:hypothetical protein